MKDVLLNLGTSIIGSLIGVVAALHFDLEGKWQQRHINHGRRLEEKNGRKL